MNSWLSEEKLLKFAPLGKKEKKTHFLFKEMHYFCVSLYLLRLNFIYSLINHKIVIPSIPTQWRLEWQIPWGIFLCKIIQLMLTWKTWSNRQYSYVTEMLAFYCHISNPRFAETFFCSHNNTNFIRGQTPEARRLFCVNCIDPQDRQTFSRCVR